VAKQSRTSPEQEAYYALAYGGEAGLSPEARAMYDRLFAVGTAGLPGPSSVIEAIENLGWRRLTIP
jgi:hypothetical protein